VRYGAPPNSTLDERSKPRDRFPKWAACAGDPCIVDENVDLAKRVTVASVPPALECALGRSNVAGLSRLGPSVVGPRGDFGGSICPRGRPRRRTRVCAQARVTQASGHRRNDGDPTARSYWRFMLSTIRDPWAETMRLKFGCRDLERTRLTVCTHLEVPRRFV